MKRNLSNVFLLMFIFSCTSRNSVNVEDRIGKPPNDSTISSTKVDTLSSQKLGLYTLKGDSVLVPPFDIEVLLSPKAKQRIVDSNETIIVAVFLEGTPKNPKNASLQEDGSFYVGSAKKEIIYGQPAVFNDLKFSKEIYDQLADKDFDLTANIYTGRRSSQNNLVTGDMLSDKISNVINRHFSLKQKLIYGDD